MPDSSFYTEPQRTLQDQFDSRPMADRLELAIVSAELDDDAAAFVASRDFFFLSTVTAAGQPTVSYKGGPTGLVSVVDPGTLTFPLYDGNGMFLSAGNINDTAQVGLLFIDFETPRRVRVQGTATVGSDGDELARFPGAILICRVQVTETFVNCGRYIHEHRRVEASPHVPDDNGDQPLAAWKQIDALQDVLPADTRRLVEQNGGPITAQEYDERLRSGST